MAARQASSSRPSSDEEDCPSGGGKANKTATVKARGGAGHGSGNRVYSLWHEALSCLRSGRARKLAHPTRPLLDGLRHGSLYRCPSSTR